MQNNTRAYVEEQNKALNEKNTDHYGNVKFSCWPGPFLQGERSPRVEGVPPQDPGLLLAASKRPWRAEALVMFRVPWLEEGTEELRA